MIKFRSKIGIFVIPPTHRFSLLGDRTSATSICEIEKYH